MFTKAFSIGLVVVAAILITRAPVLCLTCLSCRCGSSNRNYMQCIENKLKEEISCSRWAQCQTCKDNTTHCITCPPKLFGPLCTVGAVADHIRRRRQILCPDPGSLENGGMIVYYNILNIRPLDLNNASEYPVGTRITYDCNSGYQLEGKKNLNCFSNGRWSGDKPNCVEGVAENIRRKRQSLPFFASSNCQNDGSIPNGRVTIFRPSTQPLGFEEDDFELPVGTRLHYTCNQGYVLQGAPDLICEDTGYWSEEEPPKCTEVKCKSLNPVSNGKMAVYFTSMKERRRNINYDLNYPVRTRIRYSCDQGYILLGKKTLSCESTGLWSADEPICIKECGGSTRRPGTEMPGGRAQIGEFPWVVLVSANETGSTCPGVLLNHRTVLIVAHCLQDAQHTTVYFGVYHRNAKESVESRMSSEIIIHPEFNKGNFDNDIAIVKFSPDVSYSPWVQPMCLPSSDSTAVNLVPGHIGHVIGWWLNNEQLMTPTMMVASVPIQAAKTCEMAYQRRHISLKITPGMLCAGFMDRGTVFCRASSGSLLVFYNLDTNHFTVEGLVSHGSNGRCDLPERYVMFTKVSHYLQWILQNL